MSITTYVLIGILWSNASFSASGVFSQEFSSQEKCELARVKIQSEIGGANLFCVEK